MSTPKTLENASIMPMIERGAVELVATAAGLKTSAEGFKKIFADKDFPLDFRWKIFDMLASAKLLTHENYGDGQVDELGTNVTPYDDFYMERGSSRTYPELYEQIMEQEKWDKPTTDKWREQVLKLGYGSFRYDW